MKRLTFFKAMSIIVFIISITPLSIRGLVEGWATLPRMLVVVNLASSTIVAIGFYCISSHLLRNGTLNNLSLGDILFGLVTTAAAVFSILGFMFHYLRI